MAPDIPLFPEMTPLELHHKPTLEANGFPGADRAATAMVNRKRSGEEERAGRGGQHRCRELTNGQFTVRFGAHRLLEPRWFPRLRRAGFHAAAGSPCPARGGCASCGK